MVHQCKELTHSHDGSGVDRPLSRALLHLRPQELLVRREAERVGSDGRGESLCSLARAVSITFEENYFKEEKLTTKGNAPPPAAPPAPPAAPPPPRTSPRRGEGEPRATPAAAAASAKTAKCRSPIIIVVVSTVLGHCFGRVEGLDWMDAVTD